MIVDPQCRDFGDRSLQLGAAIIRHMSEIYMSELVEIMPAFKTAVHSYAIRSKHALCSQASIYMRVHMSSVCLRETCISQPLPSSTR